LSGISMAPGAKSETARTIRNASVRQELCAEVGDGMKG
jgi:hypothetical protein